MENDSKALQILGKVADSSPFAIFQLGLSPEGKISFTYVSKVIEKIFPHLKREDFQKSSFEYLDLILAEDVEGFLSSLKTSQEENNVWSYEFRVKHKQENSFRWVQVLANPESNDDLTIWSGYFKEMLNHKDKIEESEKRFKALMKNSTEGIAIISNDGTIKEISPSGKKIFGLKPNDLITRVEKKTIHLEDFKAVKQIFQEVIENPSFSPNTNIRYLRPDGEEIWVETNFNNQLNEPSINGVVLNFRDITARKKTEQLLKKERKLLRAIIDNLPLNVYVKDNQSRKVLANKSEWEFVGANSESEVLGKTDLELFDKKYVSLFLEEDYQVFENNETIINKEFLSPDINGQKRWYLVSKIPLRNEENKVEGLLGLSINITEQKLVEEQLRESEKMFKDLAKSVPGVVFQLCVDPDGTRRFLYLSSKIEDTFGIDFNPDERLFVQHIFEDDKIAFSNSIATSIRTFSDWNFEGRFKNTKGEIKWFEGISTPTLNGDKIIVNGLLLDITERKNAEDAKRHLRKLEISLEKEKEINLLKSRFISFASHEFRTPLATITTSIDILGIYVNMLTDTGIREKIDIHLNRVTSQANRLTEMLTDVLLLEKTANDKIKLQLEKIDIINLIKEINTQYYSSRKDCRKLNLFFPLENRMVYSDTSLLDHIINNLINNAFKYSIDSPDPSLTLIFNENDYQIIIKDYGIGIPLEDQKHLFEIFYRANNVLTIEGTGLGLNITQEFTDKLGGSISFISEEGKGTEFTLKFPYH